MDGVWADRLGLDDADDRDDSDMHLPDDPSDGQAVFSPRPKMPKPSEQSMNTVVASASGLPSFMKSTWELLMMCSIFSDLIRFRSTMKLKISRVTTSAVNKLAATPMVSVTPKPLISPVPMKIKMMDEICVVTCESKIVPNARA